MRTTAPAIPARASCSAQTAPACRESGFTGSRMLATSFGLTVKMQMSISLYSQASIAVGTLIAERPPHRTVRAAFPHTAPTLGNDGSTTRMQSNDWYTYAGAVSDARVALDCIPLGPRPSLH